jgi:ABC-type branched-subunit amino acid transport system ATPase component
VSPANLGRQPMLSVDDLHKEFGGLRAVDGASFVVETGAITGLIGPNGAGKSTALAIIAGALKPSSGSVLFRGVDITTTPSHQRARQGLVRTFQISGEFPRLTVLENLLITAPHQRGDSLARVVLGKWTWKSQEARLLERARDLLARFELADKEDEYAGNLSGGQKRLLQIARGLMAEPALLLLDEPMAGVNPSLSRRLEHHLLELRGEGLTILMVEHELGVVERLCDQTIVMAQGRVLAQGTMTELRRNQEVLDAYLIG